MFNPKAFCSRFSKDESGNAVVIVLVVLVIAAVGGLAYMSGYMTDDGTVSASQNQTQPAAGEEVAEGDQAEAANIEPGNPVVAKVGGEDVTRLDVFNLIQTLPPNTRQLPIGQLFPLALNEVVSARVVKEKTENVNLDNDPEVVKQLNAARENIVRSVYIQKEVKKKMTDELLQQAYAQYKASFPEIDEAKASHILVKEESKAKELIAELEGGADFAELAKENSTDRTAENGGQIGYFSKDDVVEPFADAAFKLEPGEYTKKPVESEFGYHIIKLEEKRKRPPASFEQAKPFLESQLQGALLSQLISEWRDEANVEVYDINGKPIEPAAGEETSEDAPAAEEAAE